MISGAMLRLAVISAANNIESNKKKVDALNVFPVPDGDTGTNMSMTMNAATREVSVLPGNCTAQTVLKTTASAMLRGARGNSGVILSLIFRGIAKSLRDKDDIKAADVADALALGCEYAYNAVMKPTEGTILTVIREASVAAKTTAEKDGDILTVWHAACEAAQTALDKTPEILPVLKKAGVVDAGGQGLVFILAGITRVFEGGEPFEGGEGEKRTDPASVFATVDTKDIKFAYCTEYIVNKTKGGASAVKLRAYLESIGDCVVVVEDDDIIKVHAHSNEPGSVIQAGLGAGELVNIKIDNMRYQHKNNIEQPEQEEQPENVQPEKITYATPEKPFGFVTVAAGKGLEQLFRELGADEIVSGGQTMNPSTDDILNAVIKTPAEHVFVLPNNKNIIMAAEQVVRLSERKVSVVYTKSIPMGVAALLNFDESLSAQENHMNMLRAAEKVGTGLVTFAARDSSMDDRTSIRKGQILGIENGKITVVEQTPVRAGYKVARRLYKRKSSSVITVFYGENATSAQAEELAALLRSRCSDAEVSVVNGGQPIYFFIISVE